MLLELTKQVVSGDELSRAEAFGCLNQIFSSEVSDTNIAAFLTALSCKGETAEEIAGFAACMRDNYTPLNSTQVDIVDTAGTGGGLETFNISTAASFVIAGAGVPIAKHGSRAVTSQCGSADVLEELGVKIDLPVATSETCFEQLDICFMFAPLFHPAMKRVIGVRKALGFRTVFNMLGPLLNPANANFQVIGAFSVEIAEKMAGALALLGGKRAWVVHSDDGMDELSISAPTTVFEVANGAVKSFKFDPAEFGLHHAASDQLAGGMPSQNAQILKNILQGEVRGAARDVVLINAAAAIHLVKNIDMNSAIKLAREAIDSGAALGKLTKLAEMTHADD
jgi:anthranilate phosphoribosyltransferase